MDDGHFGYKQKYIEKKTLIEALKALNQQFYHHIPESVSKLTVIVPTTDVVAKKREKIIDICQNC
jgi:hypothetical protein